MKDNRGRIPLAPFTRGDRVARVKQIIFGIGPTGHRSPREHSPVRSRPGRVCVHRGFIFY
ncbi:protein of unknown function [Nitrospina watsonii]|uniref:Uncharacterized protein n=1 Tax=Nitrospina watsonii TaxID=1323948 RepID=A0ABM9HAH6_9BACT|nr:protein of unknown function [Nitrospina watsonii]